LPTCSPALRTTRRAALPNSCPGTGNRSTPPALPLEPAYSPSAFLEKAAAMANHDSTRTTQLYDRRRDEVSLDEVERIVI
jgi:hypothetical protein